MYLREADIFKRVDLMRTVKTYFFISICCRNEAFPLTKVYYHHESAPGIITVHESERKNTFMGSHSNRHKR